ncbi:Ncs6p [Sugiyamaella lignohabitans]|uniref:Cytoplasmic tRNA 2-thiolation protein 1 n=1 Tax=Sugiyamaella lignohabitans TaxID=796027 RepID=A0A167DLJ2_9ASCO|nr:Ncs6p [Sugiyamaella lignohabitans]ANB13044.1 Ncs6p [Sugiyamaella lignohabitans]
MSDSVKSSLRLCQLCNAEKPVLKRPKTGQRLCKSCFYYVFETEIHNTITDAKLFYPGERVAIGASGGKDSTVLAYVLKTLNERYNYGVEFVLLSIDEGIHGYRDDSLETVKRNKLQYDMDLEIVSYGDLYGWTMDQIVAQIGMKNNCTYCGVFRRQALDRGSVKLGISHVVTGHNADDMAETVLMNLLRGDTARLDRCTEIVTDSTDSPVKRSKPLKYTYEKEIVLYAHYKKLDYFTTECTYSPEAFRGTARALIKNLEAVRPSSIIDVIRSGESFVLKRKLQDEIKKAAAATAVATPATAPSDSKVINSKTTVPMTSTTTNTYTNTSTTVEPTSTTNPASATTSTTITTMPKSAPPTSTHHNIDSKGAPLPFTTTTKMRGRCERCGYLSNNKLCKACVLLEGLNAGRAKLDIAGSQDVSKGSALLSKQLETLSF